MSQFIFAVKQIDLLSNKPTLLINNSDRAKSSCGAMLTFIMAAYLILYALVSLFELFSRDKPYINTQILYDNNLDYINLGYPYFFGYEGNEVDVEISLYNSGINIELKNCTDNFLQYRNVYCINDLNITKDDVINIDVKCKKNCSGEFSYGYYDILFDFQNSSDSNVIQLPKKNSILLKNETMQYVEYSVKRGSFQTDFGYVFSEIISYDFIYYERENSYSIANQDGNLLNISIKPSLDTKKLYSRSYYKGQSFFAELGGMFNFVYLLAYNLNLIYSIINLNLTIDKECKISSFIEKVIINNKGNRIKKKQILQI
jgi:hypothetical protein